MNPSYPILWAALALCATTGCAEGMAPEPWLDATDPTADLDLDFGGPQGVIELLSGSDPDAIATTLATYGMGYRVHEVDPDNLTIEECPQYFPAVDRDTWHAFNGEFYYIDNAGRPYKTYTVLPPIAGEQRSSYCQSKVGSWGDAEDPANDYDGGHLIGSQLGGWGKRANLVPQNANFNRGNWVAVENRMAKCAALPDYRMLYYVRANYTNDSDLIPGSMNLYLKDLDAGDSVWVNFSNAYQGGSYGTDERYRAVDFLASKGCQ